MKTQSIKHIELDDSDETFIIRMEFKVFDTLDFYAFWEYGITIFDFVSNIIDYYDRHQEELPEFIRDGHMFDFIDPSLFQAYLVIRYGADYENYNTKQMQNNSIFHTKFFDMDLDENDVVINIQPKHFDYDPDEYYETDCVYMNKYLRRDV